MANVSLARELEEFIEAQVKAGHFRDASEVVSEGLRLVEEREAKLAALRATLGESIATGGEATDEELDLDLAELAAKLKAEGVGP